MLLATGITSSVAEHSTSSDRWVDASAVSGGDGGAASPWTDLGAALDGIAAGTTIHVRKGTYTGRFLLSAGVSLVGSPGVVLVARGEGAVLTALGAGRVEQLAVRGGDVGLLVRGDRTLSQLFVTGARGIAVHVASGQMHAERVQVGAESMGPLGLVIDGGASAVVDHVALRGRFRQAIHLEATGALEAKNVLVENADVAVHALHAQVVLENFEARRGSGPAIFCAGGTFRMKSVRTEGHEYGVLARSNAVVQMEDFTSSRAERAGIALVQSRLEGHDVHILESGTFGGLQSSESQLVLDRFELERPRSYGMIVLGGTARLQHGRVRKAGSEALQLGRGRVEVRGLMVQAAGGTCIEVREGDYADLEEIDLQGCGGAALHVAGGAQVSARTVRVVGASGPAALVTEGAQLVIDGWKVEGTELPAVEVRCAEHARVEAGRLEVRGDTGLEQPCVSRSQ